MPSEGQLRADCAVLAGALQDFVTDRYGTNADGVANIGFVLILHEHFAEPAHVAYIANTKQRGEIIKFVKDFLRRMEAS